MDESGGMEEEGERREGIGSGVEGGGGAEEVGRTGTVGSGKG